MKKITILKSSRKNETNNISDGGFHAIKRCIRLEIKIFFLLFPASS